MCSKRVVVPLVAWMMLTVTATHAAEPNTVTIRGETLTVWPSDDLRSRGFDILDIPREENAAWVYIEAINKFVDLPADVVDAFDYAYGTAWPANQPKLAEYLALPDNRRAIELARRASAMKLCQMPYFGDKNTSVIAVLLPNLSHIRMLSKLLVAEGRRLESVGKYADALDTYTAVMRLGSHAAAGYTLIEGLVGIAVWSLADRAASDMILRRKLPQTLLRSYRATLTKLAPLTPSAQRGLQGERTFGPAFIDELCSRPIASLPLSGMHNEEDGFWPYNMHGNPNPSDGWGRLELRLGQLMYPDRAIKRHMLGYFDLVIEKARLGTAGSIDLAFDEEDYVMNKLPKWDVWSRTLMPSLSRATLIGERLQAELAMSRVSVTLRIHMLTHDGDPPADLSELEPMPSIEAISDPFSGDWLVYRRGEKSWVLYSVGPNLVDDDGRVGKRWDKLDLVRRYPPEPLDPFVSDADAAKD